MLSSENEEIVTLDDEMTNQAAINETMIEMTAHMEDSVLEKQQNDMQVKNEHEVPPPHLTTSFNKIQSWICMVLFRIYFKFKLPKQHFCQYVGLYQSYCTTLLFHCAIYFPQPYIIYTRLFDQVRWKRQFSLCVQMMRVTSYINLMNLS